MGTYVSSAASDGARHVMMATLLSYVQRTSGTHKLKNYMALVRERTIPTERTPLVSEASANFCG
jgi:hypothetical protein